MKNYEVFDHINNPVVVCGTSGKILYSNKYWNDLPGIESVPGDPNYFHLTQFLLKNNKEVQFKQANSIGDIYKDPEPLLIRFRAGNSGNFHFFNLHISKVSDDEYVLNHQECNSCLRAKVSPAKDEVVSLINSVDDLVFIFNPDLTISGAYGRFLKENEVPRENLTGYRLEDIAGQEAGLHNSMLKKALTGQSLQYEWTSWFKGRKYFFYITISPSLDEDNKVKYLIAIAKDVTDLVITKRRAEQSDKLKTAILSGFSHEIRTPLNAILGFSQLLAEKEELDDQSRNFANIVVKRSNDLLEIIENVIETALIQSGEIKVNTDLFSLNKILDEVYDEVGKKHFYNKPDIKLIKVKEVIGKNFYINSDQKILKQIFRHLIANSYKFTEEGAIEFGYHLESGKLNFFVKDTGTGIDPEKQKEIWDLFMRAYDYNRSSIGGLGIGLAIVKSLIESLNGKIWCKSLSGKGTGMFFQIPHEAESKDKVFTGPSLPEDNEFFWPERKIMIADRNDINVFFMQEVLKKSGLDIMVVKDCREADKKLSLKNEIDLLLIDLDLQEDCAESISSIKSNCPDLHIILITNGKPIKNFPAPRDYDEVIFKPLLKDSLLQSLKGYLN